MHSGRAALRRSPAPRSSRPSSGAPPGECARGVVPVEKRLPLSGSFLIRLVAFAGEKHHVADVRAYDRARDRGGTIELYPVAAVSGFANAMHDLAGDEFRILAARIVAGDDHAIGELCRDAPHFRTLAAVALAAAPEDAHQLAAVGDR